MIDNASQDDTVAALRAAPSASSTILENPRNLGYAGGNNAGIRWALARGADYVQLINSDTEVTPDLDRRAGAGGGDRSAHRRRRLPQSADGGSDAGCGARTAR